MKIRTALSDWVDKTFGGIHIQDMFKLNEEVAATKQKGVYLRNITVGLKKYEGFKKSWTDEETFGRWKKEIKEIVGDDMIKLEIKSSEGNELSYVEGLRRNEKDEEKFANAGGRLFAYQFIITIIKREKWHGE